MMKIFKIVGGLALAAMLTACGGGGGSAGTTFPDDGSSTGSNTTTAVVTPSSIEVLASANEVLSAGSEVLITAVVKNVNGVGMPDQSVVFAVNGGATLLGPANSTNSDGVATARLSAGSDKSLRNVTVTVTSGGASGQITLPVTGTRLTLSGASAIKAGAGAETYNVRLLDSSGIGISGVPIAVQSALGNGLSSTSIRTGPNGDATFLYTANVAGTDTVSISGAGASASVSVLVSAVDFVLLSPIENESLLVNVSSPVAVRYRNNGVPVAGQIVQFSTTRGTLSAFSAVTNGNGEATVFISSPSSGPAEVLAQINGVGQVSVPLQFVASVPASLVLQANPGSVLVNTGGATTNQSTIEASVRDALGNAVANRQINFSILEDDGNGGALSSSTGNTDANGRAQVQFIPGSTSTSVDGVILQATVANTSVSATTAMTVKGQALFISIGFGNTIANKDQTTYSKPFSVYVTDADGNAVGNQQVTLSVTPSFYGRGVLAWNGTVYARTTNVSCPNEDINLNGILDSGEDSDGNQQLTPGNPVVVAPGTVTTDTSGRATFALEYGEQYAPWMVVNLTARAGVAGTESRNSYSYFLSGMASDFSSETIPPAGVVSPFGAGPACP